MVERTPHICLDINLCGTLYTIRAGSIVHGLSYIKDGKLFTATGRVRVVNVNFVKTTFDKTCPPTEYFDQMVTCPSIVFDTSEERHAKLDLVMVDNIVSIDYVEADLAHGFSVPPIVDDVTDINPDALHANMTVLDRIEE